MIIHKAVATYRTLIYCALFVSLSLNYLVYIGRVDLYKAGLPVEVQLTQDYVSELQPTIQQSKKKGK